MGLFLIEPMGEKIYFLYGLLNRLNEVTLLDSWDLWFFIVKERSDDSLNVGRCGFRIFKEAFKIEDRSFGGNKKITSN